MGTFTTYVLFMVLLIASLLTIFNPFTSLAKKWEGKRPSEINAGIKNTPREQLLVGCVYYGCLISFVLTLSLFIYPFFTIAALNNRVGNPWFGYASLVVSVVTWFRMVWSMKHKPTTQSQAIVLTPEGRAEGEMLPPADEPIIIKKDLLSRLVQGFWYVVNIFPLFYIWYLFLVLIGVFSRG